MHVSVDVTASLLMLPNQQTEKANAMTCSQLQATLRCFGLKPLRKKVDMVNQLVVATCEKRLEEDRQRGSEYAGAQSQYQPPQLTWQPHQLCTQLETKQYLQRSQQHLTAQCPSKRCRQYQPPQQLTWQPHQLCRQQYLQRSRNI